MKNTCLIVFIGLASLARGQFYPHTDPGNSAGWILNDSLSDEFDGTSIDTTKWEALSWSGRMPVEHKFDHVAVTGGKAVLTTDWQSGPAPITESAYSIDAGYFQSIAFQRYGYFEIRMRALDFPIVTGWWVTGGSKTYQREIDMFESGSGVPGKEYIWGYNFHIWQTPTASGVDSTHSQANPPHTTLAFKPIDDYHTYGFEWDKDNMTLYVDGVQKYTRSTDSFRVGQRLMVGNEYNMWITSLAHMSANVHKLPATFDIEYVRAWYKPDTDVRWYVDGTNGDDSNDGLSWINAKKTIGAAVNEAFNGDEIWVAQGVYREYLTFFGIRNMEVYGGFRPGDTSLDDRNPDLYPTLVVANTDKREVCSVCDVHGFRLDGFTFSGTEGSYETGLRLTGPATDLVVANCRMSWNNPVNGGGAGSMALGHGSTDIRYENCIFANNKSYGLYAGSPGMYASKGAQVEMVNCAFLENDTSGGSGAIGVSWTDSSTKISMTNCVVLNNTNAVNEAAVYFNSGTLEMVNCTVAGNSGYGVEIDSNSSSIQPADFRNTIFYDNGEYGLVERKQFSALYNNLFFANANQLYWGGAKNSESAINGIAGASGNLVQDPLPVSLANNNLRLQSGSAAINAAQASSAPAFDADGAARSTPDIGAYEFAGSAITRLPFGGQKGAIPGRIDGTSFDEGGEGVTYHDTVAANQSGFYRGHGPDTEWKSPEGSPNIGWTSAGEWMEYTVDVEPGQYDLNVRVASTTAGSRIRFLLQGQEIATAVSPNTGGWSSFANVAVTNVMLAGGNDQVLRVEMLDGGVNYSWVEFFPEPFIASQDIGSPVLAGSMSYDNGIYRVQGCGLDMYEQTSDQFHYVNKVLNGDGYVVAKVAEQVAVEAGAKSGIMFRESLNADSKYIEIVQHMNKQVAVYYRDATAGQSADSGANIGDTTSAKWIALARRGDEFRAYYSTDGLAWILAAVPQTLSMANSLYIGFSVNPSRVVGYNRTIFNNVSDGISPDDMIPANTDSDGDGVPDDWEITKGTAPLFDDAGDDPDGDLFTSGEEFIAGTHPSQSNSFLAVYAEGLPSGFEISFPTETDRLYTVQRSEDLTGEWSPLVTVAGTGGMVSVVDTNEASMAAYHVEARLEE